MKVLFVDTRLDGHHESYLKSMPDDIGHEFSYYLPGNMDEVDGDVITGSLTGPKKIGFLKYLLWLMEVRRIVIGRNIDLVHFVYSDAILRYGGLGFFMIPKNARIMAAHHQFRPTALRKAMMSRLCRRVDAMVVHTEGLKKNMEECGCRKVVCIDYPATSALTAKSPEEARKYWNIPDDVPVLCALGGTRMDKGLDILLEALQGVDEPFHLLIAGEEVDIKRDKIVQYSFQYSDKVTFKLSFLTQEEFDMALDASDCVVIPYRRILNGASGPMTEGVWRKKAIIGPNHGSIGRMIEDNGLGFPFQTESPESLRLAVVRFLREGWKGSGSNYEEFRESLDPSLFRTAYREVFKELEFKRDS